MLGIYEHHGRALHISLLPVSGNHPRQENQGQLFNIWGGYPNSWMLYFMENPKITWMTWGSPPAIRKPPIYSNHKPAAIPSGKLT